MKGILRTLLIIVAIIVVGGIAGYFVLPAKATSTQSFTVERPPASVFARIASTPPGTVIAEGVTQTAITSAENGVVVAEVAFADGSTGTATYTVAADGDGSKVDLKIEQPVGPNPLAKFGALTGGEVVPLVEAAATSITTDLNALPVAAFTGLAYEVTQVTARPFLYNQNCSPQDASQIKEAVAQSLVVLRPLLSRFNLTQDGPPIAVETSWENNQYCFQIGYAFTGTPPRLYAGGTVGTTPAGQAIRVHYTGAEENVIPTYDQMEALIASARLTQGKSFEIYYDDPAATGGIVTRDIFYLIGGDVSSLARVAPSGGVAGAGPGTSAVSPTDVVWCEEVQRRTLSSECGRKLHSIGSAAKAGRAAFNAPSRMERGEAVTLRLAVSLAPPPNDSALPARPVEARTNEGSEDAPPPASPADVVESLPGPTREYEPLVGRYMAAELSGSGFAIEPPSSRSQEVLRNGVTVWEWKVTAREGGRRELLLNTVVQAETASGERIALRSTTTTQPVIVVVGPLAQVEDALRVAPMWLKLVTAVVLALAFLVAALVALSRALRGKLNPGRTNVT